MNYSERIQLTIIHSATITALVSIGLLFSSLSTASVGLKAEVDSIPSFEVEGQSCGYLLAEFGPDVVIEDETAYEITVGEMCEGVNQ